MRIIHIYYKKNVYIATEDRKQPKIALKLKEMFRNK